eukprot:11388453-Alexandrium_andersonii.AAC.1
MSASLVGSEMCIRDRPWTGRRAGRATTRNGWGQAGQRAGTGARHGHRAARQGPWAAREEAGG